MEFRYIYTLPDKKNNSLYTCKRPLMASRFIPVHWYIMMQVESYESVIQSWVFEMFIPTNFLIFKKHFKRTLNWYFITRAKRMNSCAECKENPGNDFCMCKRMFRIHEEFKCKNRYIIFYYKFEIFAIKAAEKTKKMWYFYHNFKTISCYVTSEVSLKRFYFALFDDRLTLKTLEMAYIGFCI